MPLDGVAFAHLHVPIEVAMLTEMAGRNPFHFSRVFTRSVDITPHRHIAPSVRGGGHDWAGRALCDGIVIDLSVMNAVALGSHNTARILVGARASDVVAVTDPLGWSGRSAWRA
jgi:hypothetical protein